MTDLLQTLGLDPHLPAELLLEELEEKNLEYLERLDACADEARADELRNIQQSIEDAIQSLRSGLSAQGAAETPRQTIPVIPQTPTPQSTPAPSTPADPVSARRMLFQAAKQGDGAAALALAEEYFKDENYESAQKWAEQAHGLKAVGAGQLLIRLADQTGQWDNALTLCVEELTWLTGYDQFALCEDLRTMLESGRFSDERILTGVEPVLSSLSGNSAAYELLSNLCQTVEARKQAADEKAEQERVRREKVERERREKAEAARKNKDVLQKKRMREEKKKQTAERKSNGGKKTFLPLVCVFLPPILGYVINTVFWHMSEMIVLKEMSNNYTLLLMALPPLLIGTIICVLTWRLSGHTKGWGKAIRKSFLFSLAANFVAFLILAAIAKLAHIEAILPIGSGLLQINDKNYYMVGTICAYYYLCIRGAVGDIGN